MAARTISIPAFERFFRAAAGLDVDKADLDRYVEFVNDKIYDLLVIAKATANANARDVVELQDLPITKGLQESIHEFRKIEAEAGIGPIPDQLVARRPPDVVCDVEAEAGLPAVAGGLSVALARTFRIIDGALVNPSTKHWERAFRIFDLLL